MGKTVRTALLLADALGLGGLSTEKIAAFIQEPPQVPINHYDFRSNSIIKTLESLVVAFTDKQTEVIAAEVEAAHQHELFHQQTVNTNEALDLEIKLAEEARLSAISELEQKHGHHSTVSADLLENQ